MTKQTLPFHVSTPGTPLPRVAFTSSVKRFARFLRISARIWTAVLLVLLCCPAPVVFADIITWVGPNMGNWNTAANWEYGWVPDAYFDEVAAINNGATVVLDSPADFPVAGVILGQTEGSSGGLEIRIGGYLQCVETSGQSGAFIIGQAGQGNLTIMYGGYLSAESLSSSSAASNSLTIIEGGNFSITQGCTFSATSTLICRITSAHSPLNMIGAVTLGGTFKPVFVDVTPTLGNSWYIIDAEAIVGDFTSLNLSAAPPLPLGHVYELRQVSGGNGDLLELAIEEASADLNDNGVVNLYDFALFANQWLKPSCSYPTWCGGADLNQNCGVDEVDLYLFTLNWLDGL